MRESSEGTVGVGSVSAPAVQAATTEQVSSPGEMHVQEDPLEVTFPTTTREKRKASASPRNDSLEADDIDVRQPNKARIIVCSDSESGNSRLSIVQGSLRSANEEEDSDMDVFYSLTPRRSARNKRGGF